MTFQSGLDRSHREHPVQDSVQDADAGLMGFANCRLNTRRRELHVAGAPVFLQPRVYDLLYYLVSNAGQLMEKKTLLVKVWGTTHVTEAVLTTAMRKLRQAIGDTQGDAPFVTTVRGVGYRFDAPVHMLVRPTPSLESHRPSLRARGADAPAWRGGRLAILPFVNATGDPHLDWVRYGLAGLLHDRLSPSLGADMLLLDASMEWAPTSGAAPELRNACASLGANMALLCRLDRAGPDLRLQARWGANDAESRHWFAQGDDETALVDQLARALLVAPPAGGGQAVDPAALAGQPADEPEIQVADIPSGSSFWAGQHARAIDLERRGMAEQALALLRTCLPHLPASTARSLLLARLLRQRMLFAQAREVLVQALAAPDGSLAVGDRMRLLAEWAALEQLQGDIPAALEACSQAQDLIAAGDVPVQTLLPVLTRFSEIDFARGEYRLAAQRAERSRMLARSLGDNATLVTATIGLARAIYMEGRADEAMSALGQAVAQAERCALPGLQAEAYSRLAFIHTAAWQFEMACDCAQRAAALASARGDLTTWYRARLREILTLIEAGHLDEAAALFKAFERDVEGLPAGLTRENQETIAWILAWRQGDADTAIRSMQQALGQTPAAAVDRRRRISFRLMISLLCTGQREAAGLVLADHAEVGYLAAQVRLQAAFAMAEGDRARAKRLLRGTWLTNPVQGVEAWDILQSLMWMVLEDNEGDELTALTQDLARLSQEQPSVPLLMYFCELRSGQSIWQPQRWAALVHANAGLMHRHGWLLDEARCKAWLQGQGPRLPVLLTDACY